MSVRMANEPRDVSISVQTAEHGEGARAIDKALALYDKARAQASGSQALATLLDRHVAASDLPVRLSVLKR